MSEAFISPGRRSATLANLPEKIKITGFSSPAADYEQLQLSLDEITGLGAPHIFFWRLTSESLAGLSLHAGDLLIVNRQTELAPGRIAVIAVDGSHRVCLAEGQVGALNLVTVAACGERETIEKTDEVNVWGVVDFVVRDLRATRF
jgi:DNA polymerase V